MNVSDKVCVGIDFGCHSIYISVTNCDIPENALSSMQTILNCFQSNRRITYNTGLSVKRRPIMGMVGDQVMKCDQGLFSVLSF